MIHGVNFRKGIWAARHWQIVACCLAWVVFASSLQLLTGCDSGYPVEAVQDTPALATDCQVYSNHASEENGRIEYTPVDITFPAPDLLEAKYTYIRSYPGGGGVFPVRLSPDLPAAGEVQLCLKADPALNARLDRRTLNKESRIAEISIEPDSDIEIRTYFIDLVASPAGISHEIATRPVPVLTLEIEMFNWGQTGPEIAEMKRDQLLEWVEANHPELGDIGTQDCYSYMTYPQILVVEHWTFLSADWEIRVCFHVMIPPHDWSMIQLRKRGEWDPLLAARRQFGGITYTISEIPVSEYPTFYGY